MFVMLTEHAHVCACVPACRSRRAMCRGTLLRESLQHEDGSEPTNSTQMGRFRSIRRMSRHDHVQGALKPSAAIPPPRLSLTSKREPHSRLDAPCQSRGKHRRGLSEPRDEAEDHRFGVEGSLGGRGVEKFAGLDFKPKSSLLRRITKYENIISLMGYLATTLVTVSNLELPEGR